VRVFLRSNRSGLYYAGREHWVGDREHALNLETMQHATDVGLAEGLDSIVMVVSSGDPRADWFVPLPRRPAVPLGVAPTSAQVPLPKAA
jgi:hypothetical protein